MIKSIWRGFADLGQNVGNSASDVGDRANMGAPGGVEGANMAQHAPNSQPAESPLQEATLTTDAARVNPSAMSIADTARVLSRIGGQTITHEMLRADIDAGAPANRDGTINLVNYAAWLVKVMSAAGGNRGD